MYGYKNLLATLQSKIEVITDPFADDPEKPIFSNVELGDPENIGLYAGAFAVVLFADTTKTGAAGMRGQSKAALIQGAVLTIIPGDNSAAALECVHYSDLVEDLLEDEYVLGISNCEINVPENSQNWRVVQIKGKTDKPKKCTVAATPFMITKSKERLVIP